MTLAFGGRFAANGHTSFSSGWQQLSNRFATVKM